MPQCRRCSREDRDQHASVEEEEEVAVERCERLRHGGRDVAGGVGRRELEARDREAPGGDQKEAAEGHRLDPTELAPNTRNVATSFARSVSRWCLRRGCVGVTRAR